MASDNCEIGFNQALALLQDGGVCIVPTETVYGLAASLWKPGAIKQVFALKKRPYSNPLIVHLGWKEEILKESMAAGIVGHLAPEQKACAKKLIEAFWPGPLTLLLPKGKQIPSLVTAGSDWVAVRCPNHPLLGRLLAHVPLVAPSANPFQGISPVTAAQASAGLPGVPVLDGGRTLYGVESSIVQVTAAGKVILLRPGSLSREDLMGVVVIEDKGQPSAPAVPGALAKHYAPQTRLKAFQNLDQLKQERQPDEAVVFLYEKALGPEEYSLCDRSLDDKEAAHNLFDLLWRLDQKKYASIWFESIPNDPQFTLGLWPTLRDRLEKAQQYS